jgi:PBSX family phage terminase large subunit
MIKNRTAQLIYQTIYVTLGFVGCVACLGIFDNINLSKENLDAEISKYQPGSVWYRRDILGERCTAEGAIYTSFINNEDAHYITADEVPKDDVYMVCVGQDFGGHRSSHTYCATAISRDYKRIYVLRSEEYDAEGKSVEFVVDKLDQFCKNIQARYGFVDYVFADSAEQAIINSQRQNLTWSIRNSVKNEIIDRIRCTDILFTSRRIKIVKDENEPLISALRSAVWDDKAPKDKRLDVPGGGTDSLDAFEYSWEYFIGHLSGEIGG